MFLHKRIPLVIGLLCALIATFLVASPHAYAQALQPQQTTTLTYSVTIQGNVEGNFSFSQSGTLVANFPASNGSSNPIDLCLNTNTPPSSANASLGDISLNSQTGCFQQGSSNPLGLRVCILRRTDWYSTIPGW